VTVPLGHLGVDRPVLAAPMAGGPTTPALVVAAAAVGSLGFLAGGYKTVDALADDVRAVRAATGRFGVNLFVPNPVPVDPDAYAAYARAIHAEGEAYGVDVGAVPITEDDDRWAEKVALLVADPVPVVSFTFAIPDRAVVASLERAGTLTVQTVTTPDEARAAAAAGVRMLVVQAAAAGGHSGTLDPSVLPADLPVEELVRSVCAATELPVLAAGGLASAGQVARVLAAGASAAVVGTALLRTRESGTSAPHRAALADPARESTVLTRAFSGRPARALRNHFVDRYDPIAPAGYPAVHHLTSPLRKAAVAAGDAERVNLWAGTGFRHAAEGSVAEVLGHLTPG
jgi:NAD(P)H-dependent flavin oxidoreductase YrpB (nitropropane dioxygenase family)